MDTNRFEFLLDRYLNGPASPEEAAELERLLQGDPELRRQFAEHFLLDVQLFKAYAGITPALPVDAHPRRRMLPLVGWLVAAMILLGIGIGLGGWLSRGSPTPTPAVAKVNEVIAGEVRIDGVALKQLPDEKWFDVASDSAAAIQLADGSQVEVSPGSKAMIHGQREGIRESFELERGGGKFKVKPAGESFRVETAAGNVTVLGTEFSVKLDQRKGESKRSKGRLTLTVAVTEGSVKVESAGKSYVMNAGDRRTFPERKEVEDD
jgi:ferric-dicitrate binding protein FerR (iron transport regulator)